MKPYLNQRHSISLFVLLTSAMSFVSDVCYGQSTNRSFSATQAATFVTGPTAVLNGMATPNGQPTSAWFQWGTNSSHESQTALSSVGSGSGVVAVTNLVTGLTLGQVYHFRLVTSNSLGVAYGADHMFAVGNSIQAWGDDGDGQTEVPAGLVNVVGVAGGGNHSLALRSDGTVAAWGGNGQGQIKVPAGLSNVVAVVGGTYHSLALQGGGTVTAWGGNDSGQTNVPVGLSNVVAIAGGGLHSLALRSEGTVVAWGDNTYGQTNVPSGLSNVVAIAGGNLYSLALRNDGTVAAWGINSYGQTNVPAGLGNVVGIAGGFQYSLALLSDGTVATWGQSYNDSQTNLITVPPLQECSGDFSLSGIKVEPTEVKEEVCFEACLVPISIGFFDQSLNLVVESLHRTIGESVHKEG